MAHYMFFTDSPEKLIHEGEFETNQDAWNKGSFLFGQLESHFTHVTIHNTKTGLAWKVTE
jgi:hypothetical protein